MTLAELRGVLGRPARFRIDVLDGTPTYRDTAVGVRWQCGCEATGEKYAALAPTACDEHVRSFTSGRELQGEPAQG